MAFKSKTGSVLTKNQIGITHATIGATLVSNCNDASDVNCEYYTNNATENKPTDTGTYLIWCHKINSSTITQFATLKNVAAKLWMRVYNGSWGDWVVITRPLDVYPVGSIYKSATSTNPAQYFGGTWTQIGSVDTCTIVGSKIVTPTSRMYAELFTLAEVQALLHAEFGIDTADIGYTNLNVDVSDNDWNNGNVAALTVFYQPNDTTYYAYFSGTTALNQQLTYTITYNREMYTFVRTA